MKYNIFRDGLNKFTEFSLLVFIVILFTFGGAAEEVEAIIDVQMIDTNAPVVEGEELWIDAEITNNGDGSDTQNIIMEVGGVQKDSAELSFSDAGESKVERFTWQTEEGDEGERFVEIYSEDDSDTTTIQVQQGEEDCGNVILTDILEDTEGGVDEIYVEWDTTNEYCDTATYEQSDIELEDEAGNIITQTVDNLSGESGGEGFTLRSDYDFGELELEDLEAGEVTVSVEATWDLGSGEDTTTVMFESSDNEDEDDGGDGVSGGAVVDIVEPDGVYDVDEDLVVEWDAVNDFDSDVELVESEVEVVDSVGRSISSGKEVGEVIDQGVSRSLSVVFDAGEFSSFDEGEWTVMIEDVWAEDIASASTTFAMEETVEEDSGSDGDDSESTSSSDSENGSEDDDIDTTEQESDSSGGEVDRCPDGFSFDEENEVCLEDNSDRLDDSNEDSVEEDYVNESNISEEDLESQSALSETLDVLTRTNAGILLLLILLTSGILFWRSNYQLDL